jgi:hypothetical protein
MLLGLAAAGNSFATPAMHAIVSVLGFLIFLAGLGMIELAMAVWYRAARQRAR